MILSLALVPPSGVAAAVADIVERVPRGPDEFTVLHRSELLLRVAGLGNVTSPEVRDIAGAVRTGLPAASAPLRIWLEGAWALENAKDPSVGVRIAGDVDGVSALVRTIPSVVQAYGFYVDRRAFHPRLSVGTITPTTGVPFLERMVADLGRYRSPVWEVSTVDLVKRVYTGENTRGFEIVESVPFVR